MTTKEYLNSFNKSFEEIKAQYEDAFNETVETEKRVSWFSPLEEKLHLLQNPSVENIIIEVIRKIQSDDLFDANDTENLSLYIAKINSIVKVADRINNFKEGTVLSENKTLQLFKLFNAIKNCDTLEDLTLELNQNLRSFIPHLFSIIKHCQAPDQFPIYYKFWRNICQEVLNIKNDYTSICSFYQSFPLEDRSMLATSYFGTLAKIMILDLTSNTQINAKEVSSYLRKNVINLEGHLEMLDEADHIINSNSPIKYWLYAPGENAYKWDEFYKNGIMALGWDDLGDLNQYQTKKEINDKLVEVYGGNANKPHDSAANFDFKNTINIGDIIVVKRGRSVLLGYGEVKSEYSFDDEKDDYKHCRTIEWKGRGEWTIDEWLALKTLTQISENNYQSLLNKMSTNMIINYKDQYKSWLEKGNEKETGKAVSYIKAIDILSQKTNQEIFENNNIEDLLSLYKDTIAEQKKPEGKYYHPEAPSYGLNGYYSAAIGEYVKFHQSLQIKKEESQHLNLLEYKKQIILQGPPGTGKTRQAKELATQLLKLKNVKELKDHPQFKLIQFHPSYTYEDFVRGIVAKPDEEGNGIIYEAENKVLGDFIKKACDHTQQTGIVSNSIWMEEMFEDFKNSIEEELIANDYKIKLTNKLYLTHVGESSFHISSDGWKGDRLKFSEIKKLYNYQITSRDQTKQHDDLAKSVYHRTAYYFPIVEKLRAFLKDKPAPTPANNEPSSDSTENYVLVIDEINRANLSSVLGELIYALEYRGKAVESVYEVDGKRDLILPPNLYIIGTMNTADRSVGHIDYAIRRRFAFVNILPKDLNGDHSIHFNSPDFEKVSQLFTTKNVSSEFEINDVQLGHSYFIAPKEDPENHQKRDEIFRMKMNYEVVPILLEYVKDGVLVGTHENQNIKDYINTLKLSN
ncbi:AAA family ATPase [Chryseobacterium sp. MEBOG06]|uniref:AAA family ATPase n=1 Tax=Chryseobacterium sp. MEBOG06 TaxID=2879938 RepID=UPI001F00261B|nr:AAA family ATPase [Chryseobacterium sp. MEBOG06]UKB82615.1 AAA family ATPase [Chryseobacterium sp. MEBOG06]